MKVLPSPPPHRMPGHPGGQPAPASPASPPHCWPQPGAGPARKSPTAGPSCSRFLPARNRGAPGCGWQREPSSPWSPGARGGSQREAGCWVPGSSQELLGNLPALPRAKSRHIKGRRGQGEPGQEPLVPAPPPHATPTAPCQGPVPAHLGAGLCTPPAVAPGPALWQPPPAPEVFSAPGLPWEPGQEPPRSARAPWAASVAGVGLGCQRLLPASPCPARVVPLGGGFARAPSTAPVAPSMRPAALGWLQRSQTRAVTEASAALRHPQPLGTTRCPIAPAAPRGVTHSSSAPEQHTAGSAVPMSHPCSPQPPSGFPPNPCLSFPTREPTPGQGFAALASTALRGCWPGSCMTSTIVLATTPALHSARRHPLLCPGFGVRPMGQWLPTAPPPSAGKSPRNGPDPARAVPRAPAPAPARGHFP